MNSGSALVILKPLHKTETFFFHSRKRSCSFQEAFNMIDQNSDGFVDKEDLHDMLDSLGKDPTPDTMFPH